MATGQEGRHVELDENVIYGANLAKDIDFLTKTEAIRCGRYRNLSNLTLKELKNK